VLGGTAELADYIVGAHEITLALYYLDELAPDLWASIHAAVDATTDPPARDHRADATAYCPAGRPCRSEGQVPGAR